MKMRADRNAWEPAGLWRVKGWQGKNKQGKRVRREEKTKGSRGSVLTMNLINGMMVCK